MLEVFSNSHLVKVMYIFLFGFYLDYAQGGDNPSPDRNSFGSPRKSKVMSKMAL
jgi:hypothetical protein